MFKRKKKKKKAPKRTQGWANSNTNQNKASSTGARTRDKEINTQYFELREELSRNHRRPLTHTNGLISKRIISDFLATGFKQGFLTPYQLNHRAIAGLVAQINRYAELHGHRVYARAVCGMFVIERSNRRMEKGSRKIGA